MLHQFADAFINGGNYEEIAVDIEVEPYFYTEYWGDFSPYFPITKNFVQENLIISSDQKCVAILHDGILCYKTENTYQNNVKIGNRFAKNPVILPEAPVGYADYCAGIRKIIEMEVDNEKELLRFAKNKMMYNDDFKLQELSWVITDESIFQGPCTHHNGPISTDNCLDGSLSYIYINGDYPLSTYGFEGRIWDQHCYALSNMRPDVGPVIQKGLYACNDKHVMFSYGEGYLKIYKVKPMTHLNRVITLCLKHFEPRQKEKLLEKLGNDWNGI